MQADEYNRRGKELIDYITHYLSTIRERRVIPDVKPGYMKDVIPDSAPVEPEEWESIFNDIEKVIMPGVVHWQSPHMHAYYPCLTSWPSILGDMLADAINCLGFTWASSPACTELEMCMMDWLCKALGLPTFFLHHHPDSRGGGILQNTVSESTLVALLAARKDKILQLRTELNQDLDDSILNSRLVAYASDQAHSSVEKAGLISLVKIRFLPTDEQFSLRGDTLKQTIQEDRRRGLVPFMLCATLGTTGVCAFDKLSELGPVCAEEGLWLHVDAAYAGSAYFCPELRWSLHGIGFAQSFVFNPSKWMMVHFDCTAFWVKDKYKLQQAFSVDPVYLRHENTEVATDFMHWQIPLSRRFRSLKLWFVMRSFGLKNLQAHIRHGVEMARLLESQIRKDPNFEVAAERHLGLVVFCLKGGNALTQELLRRLTRSGTMYLIPADIHTKRIIRFTVTSQLTTADDILKDWSIISKTASDLMAENPAMNNSKLLKPGEDEVIEEENQDDSDAGPDKKEDAAVSLKKAEVDLWIDKVWNLSRRPMRSLSCNSEPLPYCGPLSGYNLEISPNPEDPADLLSAPSASDHVDKITMSSNLMGKEVLKKLTKFYSVPSFCNQWVQCGCHQFCRPVKVSQGTQKQFSSTCRQTNCTPSSPVTNTAPTPTSWDATAVHKILE
ncbi:histidine decarboxylase [Thalassophryne amazonica]|uniref:histidine decarboxylase n=1 Tax=Thalassophryne amazonica TaxID=390379 RepID=UPI001471BA0D|nr:histidine decarboxylase [Thalassophryne amazonica]